MLARAGGGLGSVALAWLLAQEEARAGIAAPVADTYAAKPSHFAARARRVIQIFACGGVSHVDTFDYKPDLAKHDGKPLTDKGVIQTFFAQPGNLMKSPFAFARHGQSGHWASDLLPPAAWPSTNRLECPRQANATVR